MSGNRVEHLPGLEQHKALKRIVLRSVPFSRDGLYALGKVKNLEQLIISGRNVRDSLQLPEDLFMNWTNCALCAVNSNLVGPILLGFLHCQTFSIGFVKNSLTVLPAELGDSEATVYLCKNNFTGRIPEPLFTNWTKLRTLDLHNSGLAGTIPMGFLQC